jgi:hypothetical protein
MGEDEDDAEDDEEDNEDNDWSGQDDNLEAIVLAALGGNLPLAAHLIPTLHKALYSEFSTKITRKVGPWCHGLAKSAPGMGSSGNQDVTSSNVHMNDSTSNPRKRQRRSTGHDRDPDEEEDDDGDEDDEKGNPDGLGDTPETGGLAQNPRLACPFHKRSPEKYCIQHGNVENSKKSDYRACAGPGFKNIQRLKYLISFGVRSIN